MRRRRGESTMSNQMEEGWYPECDDCGCGNLYGSVTICEDCLKNMTTKDFIKLKKEYFE